MLEMVVHTHIFAPLHRRIDIFTAVNTKRSLCEETFLNEQMCVLKPQLTKGWFLNSQHVSLPRHAINALKIKLELSYLNLRFISNEGLKSHSCWERMSENSRLNNGMCFLDISYADTDNLIDRISQ